MNIYVYVYIYACVYAYTHACMCTYIYMLEYTCRCMHVCESCMCMPVVASQKGPDSTGKLMPSHPCSLAFTMASRTLDILAKG